MQLPASLNPLSRAFVDAAVEAGHRRNDDFNGAAQDGYGPYELNQRDGTRLSNSRAFLHPVLGRHNLRVFADTLVERIDVTKARAAGVTVVCNGRRERLTAANEVILSGGAVNSPQLLMLSGIGPEAQLRRHGIEVAAALPGVGHNLQDHPTVFVSTRNPGALSYALSLRSLPRIAASPLRYLFGRRGMLASNAAEAGGFVRTLPGLVRPDVQMTFLVGLKGTARTIPREHGFLLLVQLLRPVSRGHLELASSNPQDRPVMHPRSTAPPMCRDARARLLREARRICRAAAGAHADGELEPGRNLLSATDSSKRDPCAGGDRLPPGRHLQDGPGERPDGGCRCAIARLRRRRPAGGRRVGHAEHHRREHQCAGDGDRRARRRFHPRSRASACAPRDPARARAGLKSGLRHITTRNRRDGHCTESHPSGLPRRCAQGPVHRRLRAAGRVGQDVSHAEPLDRRGARRGGRRRRTRCRPGRRRGAACVRGPWRRFKPLERQGGDAAPADLVDRHYDELALLDSLDMGGRSRTVLGRRRAVALLRFYAGLATSTHGEAIDNSVAGEVFSYTLKEPVGVVGAINPWNGPIGLAIWKLCPVLASGCTLVLKPAEQAPLSPLRLAELAMEAGRHRVFNVVAGWARPGPRWPSIRVSTRSPSPDRRRSGRRSIARPPTP